MVFAFAGTFINIGVLAGLFFVATKFSSIMMPWTFSQCLCYSALYSSTDPVAVVSVFGELNADKNISAVVFGESIFNDAVSLIAFQSVMAALNIESTGVFYSLVPTEFFGLLMGSFLLGFVPGFLISYFLKNMDLEDPGTRQKQVTVMLGGPWIIYLLSEYVGFSGIVSLMAAGMVMARYSLPNLTRESKTTVIYVYQMIAHECEASIFLFIGLGSVGFEQSGPEYFYLANLGFIASQCLSEASC